MSIAHSKPSHQKMATLSKMNGALLLKCLVALCVLGSVDASYDTPIYSLSPPPLTCGCAAELELLRSQVLAEADAQCETKLEAIRELTATRSILWRLECCSGDVRASGESRKGG